MKPFNLKEALAGKPVVTRSGMPVTELRYFTGARSDYQLAGVLNEAIQTFSLHGKFVEGEDEDSFDLFMATTKKTKWVNLFPGEGYLHTFYLYETKEEADAGATKTSRPRIGNRAHLIEVEE